jgi:hypothetical protein
MDKAKETNMRDLDPRNLPKEKKRVALEKVKLARATQARTKMKPHRVDLLLAILEAGNDFNDLVELYFDGWYYWPGDGFHRLHAYHKKGRVLIDAWVRSGTERDAMIHACGANDDHGDPRSRKDVQRAIGLLLADPDLKLLSDRRLATLARCTDKTVAAVRSQLGDDGKRIYTDKWGNVSEMDTSNIGAKKQDNVPCYTEHLVLAKSNFESACAKAKSIGHLDQLQDHLTEMVAMLDKARKRFEKTPPEGRYV